MKTDRPTYDEVLEMLTAKAREGSVSAMVVLAGVMRRDPPGLDDELEQLLSDDE